MGLHGRATGTLKATLYAVLLGIILASYASPVQQILTYRTDISSLQKSVAKTEAGNTARKRTIEELQTPKGIERAARERYGMVKPGEKVYIIPQNKDE